MNHFEHRRIRRSLHAYVDAELAPAETDTVTRHVVDCPGCSEMTRQLKRMKHALRRVGDRRVGPVAVERLRDSARAIVGGG